MLKRKSKRGFAYFACERGAECGFMTWDVPTDQDCPECGQTLFKKSGRGRMKPFCVNEACSKFLPEDQRGYYKKKPQEEEQGAEGVMPETQPEEKTSGKKSGGKTTAKKATASKTSARRSTKKTGEAET